jgi:hypothetical protein
MDGDWRCSMLMSIFDTSANFGVSPTSLRQGGKLLQLYLWKLDVLLGPTKMHRYDKAERSFRRILASLPRRPSVVDKINAEKVFQNSSPRRMLRTVMSFLRVSGDQDKKCSPWESFTYGNLSILLYPRRRCIAATRRKGPSEEFWLLCRGDHLS